MRKLSIVALLCFTLLWGDIFWEYHRFAISHKLSQTQIWYYHGEVVPLYAQYVPGWKSYLYLWRWSLPPVIIFILWIMLTVARVRYVIIPDWAWICACFIFSLCMNVAVACMSGGQSELLAPFARYDMEYAGHVGRVEQPLEFIRNYPAFMRDRLLGVHADIHPPGGILFLWVAEKWFGQGLFQMCAAAIVVSATAVVPVYLLALRLGNRSVATIATALFVIVPNIVLFGATCMDGVFAILPLWGLFLFYEAISRPRVVGMTLIYGVMMGMVLAGGLFMTFATVNIGACTAIFNCGALARGWRYFGRVLLINVIAAGTVVGIYGLSYQRGWFDILDCVSAAIDGNRAMMGTGRETVGIWADVSTTNLAAFLIDVGIVVTALWSWEVGRVFVQRRRRTIDLFAVTSAVALIGIGFSTLFHFETERIWLFLVPLMIIPAAGALCGSRGEVRWICMFVVMGLLFAQTYLTQLMLYTYW
jgi:hypothetical protein